MTRALVSVGLLASAFSPLTVTLALVMSPLPAPWLNWALAALLALPLALLPVVLTLARTLGTERIRSVKVRRRDADNLSLVSSFILPITVAFFAPDPTRTPASMVVLLLLVVIYVRGGLQYLNPVLAAVGYHLFAVELESGAEVFVLSRSGRLQQKGPIDAHRLSENIYIQGRA